VTPDRRAAEASLGRAGQVLYEVAAGHCMSLCGEDSLAGNRAVHSHWIIFAAQRKKGIRASTWVPPLGRDWIESSPPTSRSGSRMLRRPRPSVFSIAPDSKPRPESLVRRRAQLESPASSTRILELPLCFKALFIASSATRNRHREASCGIRAGTLSLLNSTAIPFCRARKGPTTC